MPNKQVALALVAAALLFGVAVSGCNRNRDTRVASLDKRHRQQRSRRDIESGSTHRPAEVLSASVRRPTRRHNAPDYQYNNTVPTATSYYQNGVQMAQVYEPLPEPIPVESLPYHQQPATYYATTYYADGGAAPYTQGQPYYAQPYQGSGYAYTGPIEVIVPTPELALAKAQLQSPPVITPVYTQPAPVYTPAPTMMEARPAPIPELEPVRYQRVAARHYVEPPPPVPVMMSTVPARYERANRPQNDVQRALAPLAQVQPSPQQGWVSSPTTAMRTTHR